MSVNTNLSSRIAFIVSLLIVGVAWSGAWAAGWSPAAPMLGPRSLHSATRLANGNVLVAGGFYITTVWNFPTAAEQYNPSTNTWTSAGTLLRGRRAHTATLLQDGRVLVTGGEGTTSTLAQAELYNPATNSWTEVASMISPRAFHTAVRLQNGKVLVAGGAPVNSATNAAELYDPATNSWTAVPSMSSARKQHSAVLLGDGRVLVAGGYTGGTPFWSSAEVYNPATNSWSSVGSMSTARVLFPLVVLPSGKVLAVGGNSGAGLPPSVDAFDPATNTWAPVAPMGIGRYMHTATVLANGQVLAAGAYGRDSAELYAPATNTWTSAGVMSSTRGEHTATLLANGKVLVTGGSGGSGHLATADLYSPDVGSDLGSALGSGLVQADTCAATNDSTPACSAGSTAPDRSFTWTAPSSGTFTVSTMGSSFDTVLSLFDASTGEALGCNDDVNASTFQSSVAVTLMAGRQLRIVVDGYRTRCGTFTLNIQ